MTELKLNEKELIELTIKYGYDGSELNNPHFIEKGYLKNNNKYKKFIEKVESICESWEKLRKKKGEAHPYYIIKGLKPVDEIERINEDKRTTAQHDEYIVTMANYLYNNLLKGLNGKSFTLNKWMTEIGGLNPKIIDDELIFNCFDKLYYGADLDDIRFSTITFFKHRNQRVMGQMISNLKHRKLIEVTNEYGAILINDKFLSIDKETFDQWQDGLEEIVKNYGLKMNNYRYYLNREGYEDFKRDYDFYIESTEIKNVFITYTLILTAKREQFEISYREFQRAYNDKLIKHIIELPECDEKYQNYFSQKFRKFNYLTVLNRANWSILISRKQIDQYKPKPFVVEHMIWQRKHQTKIKEAYLRTMGNQSK